MYKGASAQGIEGKPPRELSLSAGYPPKELYVFDSPNADDIVEKLLHGQRLFLSPLVWNLRPGTFEAFWDNDEESIYIYNGKIYLPDSHHRQQALLKAVRLWRDSPTSFPKFSGARQFKLELYFLSREGEGDYFYDKNQLTKPTAKSKAYDLTTRDDLSILAKKVIEKSEALKDNVNRVTDRLTAQNPQVVTLSTLREMMKALAPDGYVDSHELEGLASIAARFYDSLASVRPELGRLAPGERRDVRNRLLVDAAVMMQGYAGLLREYSGELAKLGTQRAMVTWGRKFERLSSLHVYRFTDWSGDLFDKENPLWLRVGVVKPSRDGRKLTVLNTGAARAECARVLRQILFLDHDTEDLSFVAER